MQIILWGIAVAGLLLMIVLSYVVFLMLKQNMKYQGESNRDKFRRINFKDGLGDLSGQKHNSIDHHLLHTR